MVNTNILNEAKKELKQFLECNFAGREFFSVIYGSYAHGTQKETSDLDIIICVERILQNDIPDCVSYVTELHKRHHMNLDFEIKHENKLVIDYPFLADAVSGIGFLNGNREYHIPEIIKTPEYLNSSPLLLRFFLDSMVHKHLFLAGNENHYTLFRDFAVENLMRIILVCKKIDRISVKGLVKEFFYNGEVTGDYYLGFEDKPHHREYLESLFTQKFTTLLKESKTARDEENPGAYLFKKSWLFDKPAFPLETLLKKG